ncbi:hypothetical protein NDA11_000289 [Ustilago hordei]|uniref:Transcription factor Iwr1 domain-containing protein n=1 Tax=Ustilago hordei TaxID=120017 RepID=I2G301_USTHO|nr:uncharacterized protein UHO2_02812 [Ustilago hordei]KAJ1040499.1 hypothetical protein NDA10_000933 [Ustilago hordei]KAJ1585054.1 hypothetical protein NDA15_002366 [Ustilago hordei]KAJ1588238.1 hypothetical protein NDA12_005318 [Ustilago hordei]KAJ1592647.1 hypothetical protein NDA11_000289 [Ustilago hordei]KAJ1601441.1 hypothetical protein NDA14_002641 [Ustilago hordei]
MSTSRPSTSASAASAQSSPASRSLVASRQGSSSPLASQGDDSDNQGHGVQMILRIKRKRNQDPVDALIIQQNQRRNKRRSMVLPNDSREENETCKNADASWEASEAANKQRGVFRLAETVSLESFSDPVAARELHQRISALSRGGSSGSGPSRKPLHPSKLSQSVSSANMGQTAQHSHRPEVSSSTGNVQDSNLLPTSRAHRSLGNSVSSLNASGEPWQPATPAQRIKALASEQIDRDKERRSRSSTPVGMRFKVISKDQTGGKGLRRTGSSASLRKMRSSTAPSRPWHTAARPPEIRSKKEKEAEAIFGRIIDAETESSSAGRAAASRQAKWGQQEQLEEQDAEMAGLDAKFAEMLGDYLRSNNIEPCQDLHKITKGASDAAAHTRVQTEAGGAEEDADKGDDEDYVYDVYYRDMMPTKAGPQGSAETGLEPAQVAGREKGASSGYTAVPDSMALPRVLGGEVVPPESAALAPTWFPGLDFAEANAVVAHLEGFEDSDEELEQAELKDFESFDEGEDEDSNDEGFYRNDYPEQELPEGDEVDFDYDDDQDEFDRDEHDQYSLSDGSF